MLALLLASMLLLTACTNKQNPPDGPDETTQGEITTDGEVATEGEETTEGDATTDDQDCSAGRHSFGDWEILKEASCTEAGEQQRICDCGEVETQEIPLKAHTYSQVEEIKVGESYVVQTLCGICGDVSDFSSHGMYFADDNVMYLTDCPQTFSFNIISSQGIEYIKDNLYVCESIYQNLDRAEHPSIVEELIIEEVSENTYRVSAAELYQPNQNYYVSLADGISFADIPGNQMEFMVAGDEICEIDYSDDIVFLKQLELQSPGYYPYELIFNDEDLTYTLSLSKAGSIDSSYIGRLICIGDCTNFIEAANQSSSEIIIGKIASITHEGKVAKITLEAPALDEIYSKLNVSGGSAVYESNELLSAEYEEYLTTQLLNSEAFATALTSATIAADNFAQAYNLRAIETSFDLDNLKYKLTASNVEGPSADAKFKVQITVEYKHSVPFEKNGERLGSVDFNILFDYTNTFALFVSTNISDSKLSDQKEALKFICQVEAETFIVFDMSADLNLSYAIDELSAVFYIQNPNSLKIHRDDCRMVANYVNDPSTYLYTFEEALSIPDYLKHECKWCKPFTMTEDEFVVNLDSNMVHCGNCQYVKNMTTATISVCSLCPLSSKLNYCDACKPQEHIKSMDAYIDESLLDGNWGAIFNAIKKELGEQLKGTTASPLTSDARPIITFKFFCFEVPVYVEPQFDFDLQANFSLHYDVQRCDVYMMKLVYDEFGQYSLATGHVIRDLNGDEADSHLNVDLQGSLRTELGLLIEMRLGFLYTSKYCYIGISGEMGTYIEMAGVLHYNSENGHYYAARVESGLYGEINCVYAIPTILPAGGQPILNKTNWPFFNSGDTKAYQSFLCDDAYIELVQTDFKTLPSEWLEVSYFDLEAMAMKTGKLNWMGSKAYSVTFRFVDEQGKAVNYCSVKNGVLYVNDNAPSEFEITMYIGVVDNVTFDSVEDYLFIYQTNGEAFFIEDLAVTVKYTSQPDTDEPDKPNDTEGPDTSDVPEPPTTNASVGLKYDLNAEYTGYIVTGIGTCEDTELVIPNTYEGLPVIEIGDSAFLYCGRLTSIFIPDSVTSIGGYAFYHCTGLTSITIPDGVTSIGEDVFFGCASLTSITIPDSVTSIGEYAFSRCTSLTSITIPDSVTRIGQHAFSGCLGLTSVTIGSGVWSIGDYAFSYCDFLYYVVNRSDLELSIGSSDNGDVVYNALMMKDKNGIVYTAGDVSDKEYVLSDNGLLYQINDLSCTIYAYLGNESTITIPENINIGGTDYQVYINQFHTTAPNLHITISDGVTMIPEYAFSYCPSLTSIAIPNSVTSIGYDAFYRCTGLTSITIPDGVTSIGDDAFYGCTSLTSITIPDGVTSIGEDMFRGCTSLTSITIPDSVTSIGEYAFYGCTSLTSITIPDSVTSIGEGAFQECTGLTSITIPDSVTSISNQAFAGCSGLTSVTIGSSVWRIGNYAFSGCSGLTSITIPNSVTNIDTYAFSDCSNLTSVTIGSSVWSIGNCAFSDCSGLTSITVDAGNPTYHSVGNCIIETESKTLIVGCTNSVIPTDGSVTSIGNRAFHCCSGLTSITIPDSVTSIGYKAFSWCENLSEITIGNGISRIEKETFSLCTSLQSINSPDSVTSIGYEAFYNCKNLQSISIPNSVTEIRDSAFEKCESLREVTIGNGVTSINESTFKNCTSLRSITIPDSVTSIGIMAFDWTFLRNITIPDSVTSIGYKAFANCGDLTIHAPAGSYAEQYAKENNYKFQAL